MQARIIQRPATFDRVDLIKKALGRSDDLPGDDHLWILGGPLVVEIDGREFTVAQGFTTDGASIPAFAQKITGWKPWDPPQRWAAIVHDWLYTQPRTAKGFADLAFRAVLDSEHGNWWERNVMYWAVHLFGGPAFEDDQHSGPMIYN